MDHNSVDFALGAAGDVVIHRRDELSSPQFGEDFLADGFKAEVHMMQVNGGRARRAGLPELRDGAGEQAQHAAHALESWRAWRSW